MASLRSPTASNGFGPKGTASAASNAARKVTPPKAPDPLTVDKNVVDELLLVCGVIGTNVEKDEQGRTRIVPVTDCINWLQDLQRALRRDDDAFRPISLLLGQWKIVEQKLLPLVHSCRYDTGLVLTICKILVILTKPLSDNTKRAGQMVVDTKNRKQNQSLIREQIRLRQNAIRQAEQRVEYKRAICRYNSREGDGILSIFVSLLAEPLGKTGTSRTDSDHMTIELVLHLFRNLLSAEPLLHASPIAAQQSRELHHEFVALLEKELVLEILLVLGAEIEQRENQQYNLLLMELLKHLTQYQDPIAVARSEKMLEPPAPRTASTQRKTRAPAARGSLSQALHRERSNHESTSSRHGHFGGTLVLKGASTSDRQTYLSTSTLLTGRTTQNQSTTRKTRHTDPFIGDKKTHGLAVSSVQRRAHAALDRFCNRFVQDCYGPVMKSLKNEFRRDSVRLEDGDRVVFFTIATFFLKWWRSRYSGNTSGGIGQLIITMDLFSFNLVLNATDTFQQHKKYAPLAQATAMLSEMTHLLSVLYHSKEETEQKIAIGLMDNLFYGSEPLDRLPKLLSAWQPGTSTRAYLADLVEIVHVQLKLLEAHQKVCSAVDKDLAKRDTVAKKMAIAASFDVNGFLARRIISNHVVNMYTTLLSEYRNNEPNVNHRIVAFFLRVSKFQVATAENSRSDNSNESNQSGYERLLATKTVTLEPMLYNVHVFTVMNSILNDAGIRGDKNYATLLKFSANFVHGFTKAARKNPLLFVEALFKHNLPHRYCELVSNLYINEDIRNLAEREVLLEEQQNFEAKMALLRKDVDDDSDSSEEEIEFEDSNPSAKIASKKRKSIEDSDDEENAVPAPKRHAADPNEGSDDESEAGSSKVKHREKSVEDSDDVGEDSPKTTKKQGAFLDSDSDSESTKQTAPSVPEARSTPADDAMEDSGEDQDTPSPTEQDTSLNIDSDSESQKQKLNFVSEAKSDTRYAMKDSDDGTPSLNADINKSTDSEFPEETSTSVRETKTGSGEESDDEDDSESPSKPHNTEMNDSESVSHEKSINPDARSNPGDTTGAEDDNAPLPDQKVADPNSLAESQSQKARIDTKDVMEDIDDEDNVN